MTLITKKFSYKYKKMAYKDHKTGLEMNNKIVVTILSFKPNMQIITI